MFRNEDLTAGERAQMDQNVAIARGMVETLTRLAHEIHDRTDDEVLAYSGPTTWLTAAGIARPELINDRAEDRTEPDAGDGRGMSVIMLINAVNQLAELQDAYMTLFDEKEALQGHLDNAISEVERLSTGREFDDITGLFGDEPTGGPAEPEGGQ
jgi:hypothetical protein